MNADGEAAPEATGNWQEWPAQGEATEPAVQAAAPAQAEAIEVTHIAPEPAREPEPKVEAELKVEPKPEPKPVPVQETASESPAPRRRSTVREPAPVMMSEQADVPVFTPTPIATTPAAPSRIAGRRGRRSPTPHRLVVEEDFRQRMSRQEKQRGAAAPLSFFAHARGRRASSISASSPSRHASGLDPDPRIPA